MDLEEVVKSDKPTLINFHATWCPPCPMMKPGLEEVNREMDDQIRERSNIIQIS